MQTPLGYNRRRSEYAHMKALNIWSGNARRRRMRKARTKKRN